MGDFTEAMKCHRQHWKLARTIGDKVGQGKACAGMGKALLEKAKVALTSSPSDGEKTELLETVKRDVNIELLTAGIGGGNARGGEDRSGRDSGKDGSGGSRRESFTTRDRKSVDARRHQHATQPDSSVTPFRPPTRLAARGGIAGKLRGGMSPRLAQRRSTARGKRAGQQTKAGTIVEYCKTAIAHFRKHLSTSLASGDRADEGRAYGNLGSVYQVLEHFDKALEYHGKDLEIARELQNAHGQLVALTNLGQTCVAMGDPGKGKGHLEAALEIAQDREDQSARADLHSMLGACASEQRELRQAVGFQRSDS